VNKATLWWPLASAAQRPTPKWMSGVKSKNQRFFGVAFHGQYDNVERLEEYVATKRGNG